MTELPTIIVQFVDLKEWLLSSFGLSRDAMHVHVGLALWLLALLTLHSVMRGRGGVWVALGLVAGLSLVAEVFDVMALLSVKSPVDPWESVGDVANTLAWPAVFSLLLTWQRGRGPL